MKAVNPIVYTGLKIAYQSMVRYNIRKIDQEHIIIATYTVMDVERGDLMSRKRNRKVSEARAVLCLMLRDIAGMTYQRIGRIVGRDHSTVMYLIEQTRDWMDVDKTIKEKISRITTLLR